MIRALIRDAAEVVLTASLSFTIALALTGSLTADGAGEPLAWQAHAQPGSRDAAELSSMVARHTSATGAVRTGFQGQRVLCGRPPDGLRGAAAAFLVDGHQTALLPAEASR